MFSFIMHRWVNCGNTSSVSKQNLLKHRKHQFVFFLCFDSYNSVDILVLCWCHLSIIITSTYAMDFTTDANWLLVELTLESWSWTYSFVRGNGMLNHQWSLSLSLIQITWWRHQMETFSALMAICAGNSPVPGEFPAQRPVTRSFDVFFDLCPNKWLFQSRGWWFETPSHPLWRHCN